MANISRSNLKRIGRVLGADRPGNELARLAEYAGTTQQAMRNWTVDPSDPQFRNMPVIVKRAFTLLAYFGMAGMLDESQLADIVKLQALLESEARPTFLRAELDRFVLPDEANVELDELGEPVGVVRNPPRTRRRVSLKKRTSTSSRD